MSKLLSSYFISKKLKKNKHRGFPASISMEPTTACNLRCPQCPSGLRSFTRPTGMLSKDLNKKVIDELKSTLTYITYYFQGEPYLNPDFLDMVRDASDANIYTATSTNAHYLNPDNALRTVESGLKRLIISIDGTTQESFEKYRVGGNLNRVLDGTKNLIEARKKKGKGPFIIWQFIVFDHNEKEIPKIKQLAREIGVDQLRIKTAQIYDFETSNTLIPKNSKYSRYVKKGDGYVIKNKLLNQCWRMWQGCVVTWDGKVVPCCFDKDASHRLGELNNQRFHDIWNSPSYQSFRTLILKSRKNIDICQNCTEGTKIFAEQI
jgi:radical SAM protein with 4Fe4S-binding SPASM domain